MGSDSRIGKRFLFPGVGYGGSCFPKDVQALAKTAADYGYDFKILKSVMNVNTIQKHRLTEKIKAHFGDDLRGKTIAIWGLAFKPNTDDTREAPALYLIEDLLAAGAEVKAFDPEAMHHVDAHFNGKVQMAKDQYEALIGADALAIVTEWSVFRTPSFDVMKKLLKQPVVFDGRNLYDVDDMEGKGFHYESIGRRTVQEFRSAENAF
jgi:UDPglucose 6-dehydrogenase